MGVPVLILGESGSGKSTSMRNFKEDEVGIFNIAGKPLPFKKKLKVFNRASYQEIISEMQNPKLKRYVIDDSQYLMAFELFNRAKETGYGKFTDIAVHYKKLIDSVIAAPTDVIVYFLHHTEITDTGRIKAKTVGKMLDNHLTLEGLFAIVLICETDGKKHSFITQSNGFNTAKSPMEMFDYEIDNDLKMVDDTIRTYWELENKKEK